MDIKKFQKLNFLFWLFLLFFTSSFCFSQEENEGSDENKKYVEFDEVMDEIKDDISLSDDINDVVLLDKNRVPSKIFSESDDLVWKSVLRTFQDYEFEFINNLTGQVRTRWQDNTKMEKFLNEDEKNILASKVRFFIVLKKIIKKDGEKNIVETRVTILKQQKMINDSSKGWVDVNSDNNMEKSFLYRINQLLVANKKMFGQMRQGTDAKL